MARNTNEISVLHATRIAMCARKPDILGKSVEVEVQTGPDPSPEVAKTTSRRLSQSESRWQESRGH